MSVRIVRIEYEQARRMGGLAFRAVARCDGRRVRSRWHHSRVLAARDAVRRLKRAEVAA